MSDLTSIEKRKLERTLGMSGGYVLNFSNKTFDEFFSDNIKIDIYDEKYENGSGSKANRMRAFWEKESNYSVCKALTLLFEEWAEYRAPFSPQTVPDECLRIVERLKTSAPVPDITSLVATNNDVTFEALAKSVRESIDQNAPESGLDRLHTFLMKYFRSLCADRGIAAGQDKPLHSLVGEYIKALRGEGLIESDMTERILKSTISVMEAFNFVRNNQSFAHDNKVLNYNESLLIFGHVTSSIRFIEAIEANRKSKLAKDTVVDDPFDIPF